MILKILAVLDLTCAVWLTILQYFNPSLSISYVLGIYLIFKFILWQEFASFVDAICGVVILFAAYGIFSPLNYLFVVWLLFKGIMSLIQLRV